jgi:hypothetical protein
MSLPTVAANSSTYFPGSPSKLAVKRMRFEVGSRTRRAKCVEGLLVKLVAML